MVKEYCNCCGSSVAFYKDRLLDWLFSSAYDINGETYCWECSIYLTSKNRDNFLKKKDKTPKQKERKNK